MKFDSILENKLPGSIDWTIPKGLEIDDELQIFVEGGVVHKGQEVVFRGTSSNIEGNQCVVRIFRLGWYNGTGARSVVDSEKLTIEYGETWKKTDLPNNSLIEQGPKWPVVFSKIVPSDWCDGMYVAKFESIQGGSILVPFWLTSPNEAEGLCICLSPLNIQSRNWWGGASSTQVINGKPKRKRTLYHTIGTPLLSINRPMYNARGGDFLRWAYPLVRFLERHDIPVTYITDLDIEAGGEIPESITNLVTVGPMRYWTQTFDNSVNDFCTKEGNIYAHLGAEAGQHLIQFDSVSGKITFHGDGAQERLVNPLTGSRPSGSKPRSPWGNMQFIGEQNIGHEQIKGIVGSSWDRVTDDREIIISGKGRHKFLTYTVAHTSQKILGGRIFNAGVSNWTWALSAFGRQGNIVVSEPLQSLTLEILDLNPSILKANVDNDMIIDDANLSDLSLLKLEKVLIKSPSNFEALLYSGIRLFDLGKYKIAHDRLLLAHSLNPLSILATYRLARNHHKLKNYEEMLPLYHELLRQRPDRFHYVHQYATLLLALGNDKQGEQVMDYAISLRPNEPTAIVSLANHYRRKELYAKSEAFIEKALKLEPGNIGALAEEATLFEAKKDYSSAIDRWGKILLANPQYERATMGIARSYYRSQRYDEAYPMLFSIVTKNITRFVREAGIYCINIAINHFHDDEKIITICKLLLGNNLDQFHAENNGHIPVSQLALALGRQGEIENATTLLQKHRDLFANISEYHLVNSQIYSYARDDNGHFDSISKAFEKQNKGQECFKSVNSRNRIDVRSLRSIAEQSTNGPLVSIIMTVYMENELLDAAINSVLKQTYWNIELIIVDDCSPDNVMQYLREKESLDDRIRVVSMEKNGGTYLAKNRGMTLAKGEFVAFHDSDDWLHPCKLENTVNILQNEEQIVAVFSKYFRVDENGNILFRGKGAIRQACISLVMRREQVLSTLGYFDNVRVAADSEYEYRLITVFGKERIVYLQEPYLIASIRSDSLSQGGTFAIGWEGITGARVEYRQAYTKWHASDNFSKSCYISCEGNTPRYFSAPDEMF